MIRYSKKLIKLNKRKLELFLIKTENKHKLKKILIMKKKLDIIR